jgi:hypothetical protein
MWVVTTTLPAFDGKAPTTHAPAPRTKYSATAVLLAHDQTAKPWVFWPVVWTEWAIGADETERLRSNGPTH